MLRFFYFGGGGIREWRRLGRTSRLGSGEASLGGGVGVASWERFGDCRGSEVHDELTDMDWVVRGAGDGCRWVFEAE